MSSWVPSLLALSANVDISHAHWNQQLELIPAEAAPDSQTSGNNGSETPAEPGDTSTTLLEMVNN